MTKHEQSNWRILLERFPHLAQVREDRSFDGAAYTVEPARNGQANLKITSGKDEHYFYSRYNPDGEVSAWLRSLNAEEFDKEAVLVYGFGFGYHIRHLLQAFPDQSLWIVEPDQAVFHRAMQTLDLVALLSDRRIAGFTVGDDANGLEPWLVRLIGKHSSSFTLLVLPPYRKFAADRLEGFGHAIRQAAAGYRTDLNTIQRFRLEWIENILLNTKRTLSSLSFGSLAQACAGVPAVIAGSGPSLELEIDHLRQVRDHVLLIAAGSSVQSLLHHQLEPDLIVSMDPGEYNRRVFASLDIAHIPFLYVSTIKHTALPQKEALLLHAFLDIDRISPKLWTFGPEDAVFASSASVTGTAIQAANLLGCTDVVLIGQDFSYPNDKVYADGVAHASQQALQRRMKRSSLQVPNVSGGSNWSDPTMVTLKQDTEAVMRSFSRIRFYNASPVGAVIEQTESMPLEAIADRFPAKQTAGWFRHLVHEKGRPLQEQRKRTMGEHVKTGMQQLSALHGNLARLDNHLRSSEQAGLAGRSDLVVWFNKFEAIWREVLDDAWFDDVYRYFVSPEYVEMEQQWPAVQAERNLVAKQAQLVDCVSPLVEAALAVGNHLVKYLKTLDAEWTSA